MFLRLQSRHRIATMICLIFTGITLLLYLTASFTGSLDRHFRDWLLNNNVARRSTQNPQIVFLAIDQDTLSLDTVFPEDLEKSAALRLMKRGWPWNREVYAHIVNRLVGAGAKAVLFDLVFPSPREGDEAFRAALLKNPDKVVIGANLTTRGREDEGGTVVSNTPSYVVPTPELLPPPGVSPWFGFVNVHPDEDGLVRRVYFRTTMLEFLSGKPEPADAKEILSLDARGLEFVAFKDRVPSGRAPLMLRFAEPFLPRPLHEIFIEPQWNAPPYSGGVYFRDKIVVIGATGQSSEDRVQTPYGMVTGVQIHLNALNDALNDDFVRETPAVVDVLLISGGGLLAWILSVWTRRPILRLVLLAVCVVVYYEVAQHVADRLNLIPILFSPLLAFTTSGITWAAWEQVRDRVERQRVRTYFERYVSKDVVGEILDNRQTYLDSLGGQRKQVTVLFSDIRGFTTLTETADPHALVEQLNEYFGEMVAIVFANHGTLDKFIGDAVMAHWGSITTAGPVTDAERAVSAALQMREALARLNASWKKRGMHEWRFGIGINSGEPITGNIGAAASAGREESVEGHAQAKSSAEKFDFTVIGDAVNLASRLEGTTKEFHIDLCIGEKTADLVRDRFLLRSVALILVKGKTQPVEIFTVLDKRGAAEPPWLARHEEAARLYRAGDFTHAEKAWREVLAQAPGDGLAETFISRCVELQANPPKVPWTGVYEMKTK